MQNVIIIYCTAVLYFYGHSHNYCAATLIAPACMSSVVYYTLCVGENPGVYETKELAHAAIGTAPVPLLLEVPDSKAIATAAIDMFHDADVVYTDGSALKGGATGVGVFWAAGDPRNVSRVVRGAPPTNNVAELEAIEDALDAALQETLKDDASAGSASQACDNETMPDSTLVATRRRKRLVVVTDSLYALRAVTEWHHSWARNGWRTTEGTAVKNIRLNQDIVAKLAQLPHVSLFHIRGHMHAGNIEADRLAGKASAAFAQAAKLA